MDQFLGDISDSSGNVYVADTNNHRIQKFDSAGNFIAKWGSAGSTNGQFSSPHGVTVDSNGNVYVADLNNRRVQKFSTTDGILYSYVTKWGSAGSGNGQFAGIRGVAVDNAGVFVAVADYNNQRFSVWELVDTTAPTVLAALAPAPNSNGWNKTDTTVTLGATDNPGGKGVKEIRYQIDGGTEVIVPGDSADIPFAAEGTFALTYHAIDNANNASATQALSIKIDKSAPGIAFGSPSPAANANGWNKTDVSIGYTPRDSLSGIETDTPGSPLPFASEGANQSQSVTLTDNAGNSATFPSPAVNIDKTAPTTSAAQSANQFTLSASDSLSGVAATYYQLDGGAATLYTGPVPVSNEPHTLAYWSVDAADNEETHHSLTLKPIPTLEQLIPASVRAGYPNFKLVVDGQGFMSGAQLLWNGAPRPTTFVSYNRVIALIYAADVASPGSASLTLDNGAPGTTSDARTFLISAPAGPPNLRLSSVTDLSRTASIHARVTIRNDGTGAADNVRITAARLKGAGTSTTLPLSLGSLGVGGSASADFLFPLSAGGPGVSAMLEVSGTYSGGTFKLSRRVVLP